MDIVAYHIVTFRALIGFRLKTIENLKWDPMELFSGK
jgi:hypothetical protein